MAARDVLGLLDLEDVDEVDEVGEAGLPPTTNVRINTSKDCIWVS